MPSLCLMARAARLKRRARTTSSTANAGGKKLKDLLLKRPASSACADIDQRIANLRKRLASPSAQQVDEVKAAMMRAGWNVWTAAHDGEELAASLVRAGMCNAVCTNDTDAHMGQSDTFLQAGSEHKWYKVTYDRVLELLRTERIAACRMAILMGSDFTHETIRGVGKERAYSLIKQHGSIEGVLASIRRKDKGTSKFTIPPAERFHFKRRVDICTANAFSVTSTGPIVIARTTAASASASPSASASACAQRALVAGHYTDDTREDCVARTSCFILAGAAGVARTNGFNAPGGYVARTNTHRRRRASDTRTDCFVIPGETRVARTDRFNLPGEARDTRANRYNLPTDLV